METQVTGGHGVAANSSCFAERPWGNHTIPDPHFITTAGDGPFLLCEATCDPTQQKAAALNRWTTFQSCSVTTAK